MLDRYWFAKPVSLAIEAPVPVVSISTNEYRAGGAANVALNIKKLGGDVAILAPLGADNFGAVLSSILDAAGIKQHWLYDTEVNTITKHRVLTHKQQFLRVDFEQHYKPITINHIILDLIAEYDVIVCSDYNKGSLLNIAQIIESAKSLNKLVLVDPKGNDFTKYKNATIITPNHKEFTEIVGDIVDAEDFDNKAYELLNATKLEYLLVTCGSEGMILFGKNNYRYSAISYAQQVYDVTGAGDTVLASLAVSLSQNEAYSMAVERASHAAACVVSQVGTGFVTKEQIDNQMLNYFNQNNKKNVVHNKIISIAKIEELQKLDPAAFVDCAYYLYNIINAKDHVITKKRIADIIALNNDKVCIILSNKLNDVKHNLYNLEEIAYILSKIAVVRTVIYSLNSNIDLCHSFEQFKLSSTKQEFV